MKHIVKILVAIILLVACLFVFSGCEERKMGNRIVSGKDVQTFTYAYVILGGQKVAEGAITQWRDYDDSDTVQVLINGKFYLTHYTNVVLIADPNQGALTYGNASWVGIDE